MIVAISGKIKSGKDTAAEMFQQLSSRFENRKFADKIKDIVCLLLNCTRVDLEDSDFKNKKLGDEWAKWKVQLDSAHRSMFFPTEQEAVEEMRSISYPKAEVVKVEMTPRKLMQLLGTEAGREIIHPDIWVNSLFAEYEREILGYDREDGRNYAVRADYPDWIISDMRFLNELNRVVENDGITIRIERKTEYRFSGPYTYFLNSDYEEWENYLRNENQDLYEKLYHPSETSLDNIEHEWDYILSNNATKDDLFHKVKTIHDQVVQS